MEPAPPQLVLDTNVIVVMYTLNDLLESIANGEAPARQAWRRNQAHEALCFGIYLDANNASTVVVPNEAIRKINELSPREATIKGVYTWLFVKFVRPKVLPNWHDVGDPRMEAKGNAADRELVRLAQQYDLPLVTFEGHTPEGIVEKKKKLRERAKDAGVPVFTPGEYLTSRARRNVTDADVGRFLARYEQRAPAFSREHPECVGIQAHVDGLLTTLRRLLDH